MCNRSNKPYGCDIDDFEGRPLAVACVLAAVVGLALAGALLWLMGRLP